MLDVREVIRRLRAGETERRIAQDLDLSRNTVAKYRDWARSHRLLEGDGLPELATLEELLEQSVPEKAPGPVSTLEPWRELIEGKRSEGVELTALLGILREHGFEGSYSALRRFAAGLQEDKPKEAFLRMESSPGEEAQVDFGYAGEIFDEKRGKLRKAWVFVMTLSWSRHQYAEIVFDQRVDTWIDLHVRAFEHFGGRPSRVVIDNLKSAITKAVIHDAEAQRSYRDLAEHYGFLISPCRPRTPRHKGKVESGVRYVKRNALAGRTFKNLQEANAYLERWVMEVAGRREHGTTHEQPLERFEIEKHALAALPPQRYETVVWKKAKLHSDCHVVFEYSFYSAPHRLVAKELVIRATPKRLEIYHEHERVASHERAWSKGTRVTNPDHYPPGKLHGLLPQAEELRAQASRVGPLTYEFIERLLGQKPLDRVRGAQAVLRLEKKHGKERLEAACGRALRFDEIRCNTVKRILRKGLEKSEDDEGWTDSGPLPKSSRFARSTEDFVAAG